MSKVSEVMQRDVFSVTPTTSILEVARKMSNHKSEMVTVCENGKYRGIVTREDIISCIASDSCSPKRQSAGSFMHSGVPKVSPGTDIIEAAKIMARHASQHMPVVQDGKLMGVLTLEDLLCESPALAVIVMTSKASRNPEKNLEMARVS